MPCPHIEFSLSADIVRLTDGPSGPIVGFTADLRVTCAGCGEPFVWLAPAGVSADAPTTSLDGLTLRAPIVPAASRRAPIDDIERAMGRPGPGEA